MTIAIVTDFPRPVREIENIWIPLADGVRLAARIWLPEDAKIDPVPAVLEYLPYRKRDFTCHRDERLHPWLAGHGYAMVRVDIRGTGDSEGSIRDEYSADERRDALEIFDWLRRQPWCDGNFGMMGISWGGINSLQVAALRPKGLKAIITLASTDDRYATDVHYMGGLMLTENPAWDINMFGSNPMPPDPLLVGDAWRAMWLERLEANEPWSKHWVGHQRRDDYWKDGSVCESYADITCAVYAICGWEDGYVDPVFRLMENLRCPRKALVGPWAHFYPYLGEPGPTIGFHQEALRWWDHWLKDRDNGIMDEPPVRLWLQDSMRPAPAYKYHPGRWIAGAAWPSSEIGRLRYFLTAAGLRDEAADDQALAIASPQSTGDCGGRWSGYGYDPDMPLDQRSDDGKSLCIDSPPLVEDVAMVGQPHVYLEISADKPNAFVAVRLCDVAPDGSSTRVSFGVLNLTHRESHENPQALEPGRRYRVTVALRHMAYIFPRGHRIRVAISNAYWPIIWPSPEAALVTIYTGKSRLDLPVRASSGTDGDLRPFEAPLMSPAPATTEVQPSRGRRIMRQDAATGERTIEITTDYGVTRLDAIDLTNGLKGVETFTIRDNDPLSARFATAWTATMARGDWHVRLETCLDFSASRDEFHYNAGMMAYEGDKLIFERRWTNSIQRDLV